ncbi:hypothetical protein [Catenovulum agarivorans]|nr:hypothetical protein [Catenovulum agarivorans]
MYKFNVSFGLVLLLLRPALKAEKRIPNGSAPQGYLQNSKYHTYSPTMV